MWCLYMWNIYKEIKIELQCTTIYKVITMVECLFTILVLAVQINYFVRSAYS